MDLNTCLRQLSLGHFVKIAIRIRRASWGKLGHWRWGKVVTEPLFPIAYKNKFQFSFYEEYSQLRCSAWLNIFLKRQISVNQETNIQIIKNIVWKA